MTADFEKWVPHKLYFGHGRGSKNVWGPRRINYSWTKKFTHLWRLQSKRKLLLTNEEVPPGTVIHDANELAKVELFPPEVSQIHIAAPWPYESKYVKGSKEDPLFQPRMALHYDPALTLYEGIKGANHFTHSIVEEHSFPPLLLKVEEDLSQKVPLEQNFIPMVEQRLEHALRGDSAMIAMPRHREFPKINYVLPRRTGIHPFRKDESVLKAFSEISDLLIATQFGLNRSRQIQWPTCIVPFEREESLCVLNLKTNWLTVCQVGPVPMFNRPQVSSTDGQDDPVKPNATKIELKPTPLPLFSSDPSVTLDKDLPLIDPVDWRINFEETNFYPTNFGYSIPEPFRVNTLFLTNNNANPKPQPDRMVFGRGMLYCYGYLVSLARRLYGSPKNVADESNYKDLPKPLTIQLAFYNATKSNIGFICFQLNTLSFDSKLKNQVWLDGPHSIDETGTLLRKFAAMNLVGQGYGNN